MPRILHTLGFGELVWIEPPGRKIAALFGGQDVEEVWERWVWSRGIELKAPAEPVCCGEGCLKEVKEAEWAQPAEERGHSLLSPPGTTEGLLPC